MTWNVGLQLAQFAVSVVIMVALYAWRGGQWTGEERRNVKSISDAMDALARETNRRFDEANKLSSNAASYMQRLESRIITDFAPRDLTDERFRQNQDDHRRFERELEQIHSDLLEQIHSDLQSCQRRHHT